MAEHIDIVLSSMLVAVALASFPLMVLALVDLYWAVVPPARLTVLFEARHAEHWSSGVEVVAQCWAPDSDFDRWYPEMQVANHCSSGCEQDMSSAVLCLASRATHRTVLQNRVWKQALQM